MCVPRDSDAVLKIFPYNQRLNLFSLKYILARVASQMRFHTISTGNKARKTNQLPGLL